MLYRCSTQFKLQTALHIHSFEKINNTHLNLPDIQHCKSNSTAFGYTILNNLQQLQASIFKMSVAQLHTFIYIPATTNPTTPSKLIQRPQSLQSSESSSERDSQITLVESQKPKSASRSSFLDRLVTLCAGRGRKAETSPPDIQSLAMTAVDEPTVPEANSPTIKGDIPPTTSANEESSLMASVAQDNSPTRETIKPQNVAGGYKKRVHTRALERKPLEHPRGRRVRQNNNSKSKRLMYLV